MVHRLSPPPPPISAKYINFLMTTLHRLPNGDFPSKGTKRAVESTDEAGGGKQSHKERFGNKHLTLRWEYG